MRFFLFGIILPFFGSPLSWAVSIDEADSATVLILSLDKDGEIIGTGSGFFVSDDGHVLTNAHVVGDLQIETLLVLGKGMPKEPQIARKIWIIPERDIAVVITKKPDNVIPLELLSADPSKGEAVWALGYPGKQLQNMESFEESFEELDATLTNGIVSRVFIGATSSESEARQQLIQHTAEISQGNSGGPLINECGVVVGMNYLGTTAVSDEVDDPDFFAIGSRGILEILSTRIDGIISSEGCTSEDAPEILAEVENSEIQSTPEKISTPQITSSQNLNILFFIVIAAILAVLYYYLSRARPETKTIDKALERTAHAIPKDNSLKQILRMSGFNGEGRPISFLFEVGKPFDQRGWIIGRDSGFADFEIVNKDVSRAHAQVKVVGEQFYIRDLGSTNTTQLNGINLKPFNYVKMSFSDEIVIATCVLVITR